MLEEGILSGGYKRSGQHCTVETSCLFGVMATNGVGKMAADL